MTQTNPIIVWDAPGAEALPRLDEVLLATRTHWAGPIAPAEPHEGQLWTDNSMTDNLVLKQYYTGLWIEILSLYDDGRVTFPAGSLATRAQALAGEDEVVLMTPKRVKEYIAAQTEAYDTPFNAGLDDDDVAEDLEVKTYGSLIFVRTITPVSVVANLETAPTGSSVVFDILLNGTSIFTATGKPSFLADTGNYVVGRLKPDITIARGAVGKLLVTQIGLTTPGQGLRISLEGKV